MKPLLGCTACFSEGRRPEVIEIMVEAMSRAGGIYILNVRTHFEQNQTEITLVGLPSEVEKAIFAGVRVSLELINLNQHRGDAPRFGAADLIAFMPIRDLSLDQAVESAQRLGRRVAQELEIPVYFFAAAALRPDYYDLEAVHHLDFQYEQLSQQIGSDPRWMPDFGPARLTTAGATFIGAHLPPIHCKIRLNTDQLTLVQAIAAAVAGLRDVKSSGTIQNGKGLITLRLLDYEKTPLARIMELIRREAARYGVLIEGSNLVDLLPQAALNASASWYLQFEDFAPEKVLEIRIAKAETEQLSLAHEEPPIPEGASMRIVLPKDPDFKGFTEDVASATVTPGGGAVSALAGALAAALAQMVSGLTIGKRGYDDVENNMLAIQSAAAALRLKLVSAADQDVEAFQNLMRAIRLPTADPERENAIQSATVDATDVPLEVVRQSYDALLLLEQVIELGNHNAVIDAAVGAQMGAAAVESAALNVRINLLGLNDAEVVQRYLQEVNRIVELTRQLTPRITAAAMRRVGLSEGA